MATNLFCCVPNVNNGNFMLAFRVGPKQRPVTDQIDQPGNAFAGLVELAHRALGKDIAPQARHVDAITKIGPDLVTAQGIQVITGGYPLVELAQFRTGKNFLQLGLAKQHNLQQLLLGGFQVGQQA